MQYLKLVTQRLLLSLSDVQFYKRVWHLPLRQGLLFFTWWMIIIGLISSSYFALQLLPSLKAEVQETVRSVPHHYPDELQIFLSNNTLSMSEEFMIVPLPKTWLQQEAIDPDSTPDLLAVLASTSTTPTEWTEENTSSTLFFVNHTTLYIHNFNQSTAASWTEFPLEQVAPNTTVLINKNNIADHASEVANRITTLFPYIQVAIIVGLTFVHYLSRLLICLFESIFIFLLLKIYGKSITIQNSFKFGLHLLVPAEIINQVAIIAWPNSPVSLLSLSFWILAIYILFNIHASLPAKNNAT